MTSAGRKRARRSGGKVAPAGSPAEAAVGEILIEVTGLSVRRGERALLRGIHWTIRSGEAWALLGPNGSGKSTLIKALSGEIPTCGGEIEYRFARKRRDREPWRRVAHVSLEGIQRLLRGASGYHQARWHAGEDGAVPSVRDVLSRAAMRRLSELFPGSGRLAGRKLTQLSNGERRKVAIVLALEREPEVLVLDQPFSGLDRAARRSLERLFARLLAQGLALVITVPRASDCPTSVRRWLHLREGRTVEREPGASAPRRRRGDPAIERGKQRTSPSRTAGPPIIELESVTVRYDGVCPLRDITWTVRRGERWALLGANGAGKTTLLSLILADNPQAYGQQVRLFGRQRGSGESIWEIKKRIGFVSPELHLFHHRDVDALAVVASGLQESIGLHRQPTPAERRTALAWLARVGLRGLARSTFRELSEGEQRRLLLARALIKRPELLILDEPCQGLDEESRSNFLEVLERAARSPRLTVIHVTHDLSELPANITHLLELGRGRIRGQRRANPGTPLRLLNPGSGKRSRPSHLG